MSHVRPTPPQTVALDDAAGRRLAEPVVAPFDVWPFPRAAMDGFAVRSADVARARPGAAVELPVVASLCAGQAGGRVGPGEAIRIMTGAVMPEGADAVVPFEDAEAHDGGNFVHIRQAVPPGKNVFPPGEDARAGQTVLVAGELITPSTVGLLAALGLTAVRVHRRPRAYVLAVGDELIDAARESSAGVGYLQPGRVLDSNSPALTAALRALGADVLQSGIVPDDPAALREALRPIPEADLLVISGGASAGDRDYTLQALVDAGAELIFARLLVKPGKPAAFFRMGRCPVFALPGSPGAAMTAFLLLVAPAVQALAGAPAAECRHPIVRARLMRPIEVSPGRPHHLWGRLAFCAGVPAVWPVGPVSTAVLRWQALANALVVVPADYGRLELGTSVDVVWFDRRAPHHEWLPVPVIGVSGPHNSGKTTLLEALIPELGRRNIRAAALKHDVHGFQMDYEGKDTWRLARAGASTVAIAGVGRTAALWYRKELALNELAALLGEGVELVLVEGYRGADIPRIEVVPPGHEPHAPPAQLVAVVSRAPKAGRPNWFDAGDTPAIAGAVENWLRRWEREAAARIGVD